MIEDIKKGVRATVCAVIERGGRVLLVKRNTEPFNGYWTLPGGHIDFGETAENAVIREVKEETGLSFKPKFLGYRDELYPEINWHGEVLIFYGEAGGDESIDGKEITGIKWVELDKLKEMNLAFEHEKTVEKYIEEYIAERQMKKLK